MHWNETDRLKVYTINKTAWINMKHLSYFCLFIYMESGCVFVVRTLSFSIHFVNLRDLKTSQIMIANSDNTTWIVANALTMVVSFGLDIWFRLVELISVQPCQIFESSLEFVRFLRKRTTPQNIYNDIINSRFCWWKSFNFSVKQNK